MLLNKSKNTKFLKKKKHKFLYSVLSVVMLSIVGISTVSINKTYAADVYPTITNTQANLNNEDGLSESLWDILSNFITFIKEWIEKNNAKYSAQNNVIQKHNFNLVEDTNKLLNNNWFNKINFNQNSSNNINQIDNFSDISNHNDKYYINYLSNQWIISKNNWKFNPDNFIRLHELSKLLVNSYRYKLGYNIDKNRWLTNENYFTKTMPKYYNTAYEMWLLEGVENIENFERFIAYNDIQKILSNFHSQYPDDINQEYINNLDIKKSTQTLKRWEICRLVIKSLKLDTQDIGSVFTDTSDSKYGEAIEQLAKLELVNIDNDKFYPENRITRGEFVDIFINSYLKANDLELSISNFNFNIDDLDYNSDYAKFIVYAQEKWLTNYFFETKRWKTYINVNKAVTKHEAYYIIAQSAWVQINYDIIQADQEYITRWEVSQLIIDSFNFTSLNSTNSSQLEAFVDNIKSFTETKKLLSLLF